MLEAGSTRERPDQTHDWTGNERQLRPANHGVPIHAVGHAQGGVAQVVRRYRCKKR
jgi:hypothetical protein